MALSNDLISQFVEINKGDDNKKTERTVYGTVKISDGKTYVQIDGSTAYTPISTTASAKDGDRVMIMIKDHSAVITGNMTDPSASKANVDKVEKDLNDTITEFDIVLADKVSTEQLNVVKADIEALNAKDVEVRGKLTAAEAGIDKLEADNVKINGTLEAHSGKFDNIDATFVEVDGKLTAANAEIDNLKATDAEFRTLEADYGEFKQLSTTKFGAIEADIEDLDTKKLSAEEATIKYANIDFTNIGEAAMEYFYAKSGLIEDVKIGDATIVGNLVGVTIRGDRIIGNTIMADKLVIKGEDGLYYKLNYEAGALSGDEIVEIIFYKVNYGPDGYIATEEVLDELEGVEVDGAVTNNGYQVYSGTDADGESIYFCTVESYPPWASEQLHGSAIVANSITAEKIDVKDLVAFGATIGGFVIDDNIIRSRGKESAAIGSGVYMDADGQFSIGDEENYLRFYKTEDGTYRLEISANSVLFGGTAKNSVEDLKDLTDRIHIGTYQAPDGSIQYGVEFSEVGSEFKLRLTNEGATFVDGSTRHTAIDSDGLNTENIRVDNDFRQTHPEVAGEFVWAVRGNGNYGLQWKEDVE